VLGRPRIDGVLVWEAGSPSDCVHEGSSP
jgi:hypothetical protein